MATLDKILQKVLRGTSDRGLAKPYQVRQVRNIITRYGLRLPGEENA